MAKSLGQAKPLKLSPRSREFERAREVLEVRAVVLTTQKMGYS
jgi:hypothetical protein